MLACICTISLELSTFHLNIILLFWFSSPSNMLYICWIYPWLMYWGWFIFKIILKEKIPKKKWKIKCMLSVPLRPKYPRRKPAWRTKVISWLYIFSSLVLCWFHRSAMAILFLFQENTHYVLYWTTDWCLHAPGYMVWVRTFMHLELYHY